MKKLLSILLFLVALIVLVGVASLQSSSRKKLIDDLSANCLTKPVASFSSIRAHGVIIRDRTLLSVRLEGEKNFSPPGGHLENGENPETALSRELKEELGIKASPRDFKEYKTYCDVIEASQTQRTHSFFVEDWSGELSIGEKDQIKWVTSEYKTDPDADSELIALLEMLKKDNLIDWHRLIESEFIY